MSGFFLKTILIILIASCKNRIETQKSSIIPITGTWELISATTIQGDSTYHKDLSHKRMIKIINESHFAFLNHDLDQGKDSLQVFVAGAGTYKLIEDKYTEFLEYCNYREWEKHIFEFTVELKGDTLIQNGVEKIDDLDIDRIITEKYIKTEK